MIKEYRTSYQNNKSLNNYKDIIDINFIYIYI